MYLNTEKKKSTKNLYKEVLSMLISRQIFYWLFFFSYSFLSVNNEPTKIHTHKKRQIKTANSNEVLTSSLRKIDETKRNENENAIHK